MGMSVAREVQDERRLKELRLLESHLMLDLRKAAEARKEIEFRANELTINCLADHRAEVQRTIGEEARSRSDYAHEIEDEVNRLTGLLEEQRAARIAIGERVAGLLDMKL